MGIWARFICRRKQETTEREVTIAHSPLAPLVSQLALSERLPYTWLQTTHWLTLVAVMGRFPVPTEFTFCSNHTAIRERED